MFSKKIFILLSLFVVMSMVLLGCSSSKNNGETTSKEPKASVASSDTSTKKPAKVEQVELTFWDMAWGPQEYVDTAKKLIEQFTKEHPNIKVKYQPTAWDNWYQTFTTAIATNTAPDLSTGGAYQAFQFYKEGAILPVNDLVEKMRQNGTLNDFYPGAIETLKYDGNYVSLPWGMDIRVPFYRKDLLEAKGIKEPKNFKEFKSAMLQLSGDGKYGMTISGDTLGTQGLFSLMLNNGGGLFTKDQKLDFMNERNVEAATLLSDLVKAGAINKASVGLTGQDSVKAFSSGMSAFMINSPGFAQALPELKDKIGVMDPMEGYYGDKGTIAWVGNMMIYKQTKHPEEAKIFLQWWIDNIKPLFTEGKSSQLPARKSFTNDPYFQKNPILNEVINKWMPVGQSLKAKSPGAFPALNTIEGDGSMVILIQSILSGDDPKKAMLKAEKEISKIK